MTLLDGILLAIVLLSAMLAMIRGFAREVFSIASWVAAAVATYMFWDDLLPHAEKYIPNDDAAKAATILGIFIITLFVVTLITMRISDFILDSKAGPLDRTMGFLFGAARGLLLVVICVLFVNFFMEEDKQWTWISEAKSKPWLDDLGNRLLNMLPEDPEAVIMDQLKQEEQGTGDGANAKPAYRTLAALDSGRLIVAAAANRV